MNAARIVAAVLLTAYFPFVSNVTTFDDLLFGWMDKNRIDISKTICLFFLFLEEIQIQYARVCVDLTIV